MVYVATPTHQSKGRRPRDMALSMLVLIVPVFLLVGFYRFLGNETPPAVDPTEVYGSVQRAGQFQPLKPEPLPDGWRIASATYTDGALRVGLTAPDDGALQLVESAAAASTLLPAVAGRDAHADGTVTIGGVEWQRYTGGRPGEQALLQEAPGRTVIVVGHAKDTQFGQLVLSLKA
jgi:hypothetical protein